MSAPASPQRHCPSCGRGPFFVVKQRVPAGAPFYFDSSPPPAAGVVFPSPGGTTTAPVNSDTTAWLVGDRIEIEPDGLWRRIRP